jgi:hypothetical protein
MQKSPALWAPVEAKWLEAAFNEFENGKPEIAFRTDAEIGQAGELPIKHVYFKATGTTEVVAVADFIRLTTTNPKQQRLIGQEDKEGKYYRRLSRSRHYTASAREPHYVMTLPAPALSKT